MKKIAVVLCGAGFKDGSEIRESVAVLWALSMEGAEAHCFAPDAPQADVVNCLSGQPVPGESRNQLVEAARIARGSVRALSELRAESFDGLALPGGFGAAKNLCSFAKDGARGKVIPDLQRALETFHASGKPIAAVCIAPAILALAFPGQGLELTLGAAGEASAELEKLGHRHIQTRAHEWHADRRHLVVSTPAYMWDNASLKDIFTGVHGMVRALCSH